MLDVQADKSLFQSTLSMRRATVATFISALTISISIHALHEESDRSNLHISLNHFNFNPRSP